MRWTLERVPGTGPSFEPVTLAEMKAQLRATSTALDANITDKIVAAREWAEDHTGRALVDQEWRLTIAPYLGSGTVPAGAYAGDYRPSATGEILLRRSPVLSVVSVSTFDADGVETEEDPVLYEIRGGDTKWPTLFPLTGASWGSGEQRIVFRAGYADTTGSPQDDASVIPACFKQAIMLHVEAHYDRPDNMKQLLDAAKALLKDKRTGLGIA